MTTLTIDAIVRNLSQTSSRRHVFRWLGGAATLGALAVVELDETHAKRKKKGKKGKGKGKGQGQTQTAVCRPGEQIAHLEIPGGGNVVYSPVLAQGQPYTVTVSGIVRQGNIVAYDADYQFPAAFPYDLRFGKDIVGDSPATEIDMGLAIDDATIDGNKTPKWGPYNVEHVYTQRIVGQGRPAAFQLHYAAYPNSSGTLSVDIVCA
jgi:hypothetical protein